MIATVGPFAKYGQPMVHACVESSTHYVDITGEPQFVRAIIDRYHTEAESKKLKIVSCCGFDCIPADLGTLMIANHIKEKGLVPAEIRVVASEMEGGASGGTLSSVMNLFGSSSLRELVQLLNPYFLCPRVEGKKKTFASPIDKPKIGNFISC